MVTTEIFVENYKKYDYDSYIFGKLTRYVFIPSVNGKKHIKFRAHCYSFLKHGEKSLFGIEKKNGVYS